MKTNERASRPNDDARPDAPVASRRTVLAGLAALPVAGAAGPALPAGAVSFPDLAARWAPVFARWRDHHNQGCAIQQLFEARVEAATGMTLEEAEELDQDDSRGRAYFDFRYSLPHDPKIVRDPVDGQGCSIVWNEIHAAIDPLIVEILSQPARSLADLALQAQAFAVYAQEAWTDRNNDNVDDRMRVLVDNLCALAGVEALPGVAGVRPQPELEA